MMKGDHGPTKLLHALTWGAFDNASYAPQVRACNYYLRGGNDSSLRCSIIFSIEE